MKSIEERFAYYFGHDAMPAWLEAALAELGDKKEHCLIMSIKNFKEIAEQLFPAANSDSWSDSFYVLHKNNALTMEKYGIGDAYRTIVGTRFEYFGVSYGPGMPMEWCTFSMSISSRMDGYVILTGREAITESQRGPLFFSGGCMYYEPSDYFHPDMKCK